MDDVIYLDAAASTPVAPAALVATIEALREVGNPGAAHARGQAAAVRVEAAREAIAALMEVGPACVTFLGSATEANNLALRGLRRPPERAEIVTSAVEHPSVLKTALHLDAPSGGVRVISVTSSGEVDIDSLAEALSERTALVSVQAANNEVGVLQPLKVIAEMAHSVGALVHADASQLMAWGQTSLLRECDLVTISSHKMHGPQGAAALIARPRVRDRLSMQTTGGGQERGLRSGTANVAAITGFGVAAELALESGHDAAEHVKRLRIALLEGLLATVGDVIEHGSAAADRLPGTLNVALGTHWAESVEADALLARSSRLAASTGSACHAGTPEPSPVLLAMGISEWEAARSIRLSLSRYSTLRDVQEAASELGRSYAELKKLVGTTEALEGQSL